MRFYQDHIVVTRLNERPASQDSFGRTAGRGRRVIYDGYVDWQDGRETIARAAGGDEHVQHQPFFLTPEWMPSASLVIQNGDAVHLDDGREGIVIGVQRIDSKFFVQMQ